MGRKKGQRYSNEFRRQAVERVFGVTGSTRLMLHLAVLESGFCWEETMLIIKQPAMYAEFP